MTSAGTGLTASDIFAFLMDSQHWDKDRLLAYQRTQLEQLLRHAKAQVPFYEKRLDVLFRRDGSIDWSRWDDVPVLTRADLRDHGKALMARSLPPAHGKTADFYSSGSTGVPVKVTTTTLAGVVHQALWQRVYALNKVKDAMPEIKFWFTKPDNTPFEEDFTIAPDGGISGNRNLLPQKQLDVIARTGARRLSAFSAMMVQLAMENRLRDKPVKLDVVLPYGMALSPDEREIISQSFDATVICPYSSKESGLIAFQVVPDLRYVLNAEALMAEFLPTTGENVLRRMIVTPLFNAAQPLIRYDQGDLVEVSDQTFGRGALPIITRIVGRADDYFIIRGARVPVAGLKDAVFMKNLQAKAFQIAQIGDSVVEVRYLAEQVATPVQQAEVTRHLHMTLRDRFDVLYTRCETIPTNAGGKPQRYKREWSR